MWEREIAGRLCVSTVWIGIDHSFGHGPPLYFETMLFLDGDMGGCGQWRYQTEAAAKRGHHAIADFLKEAIEVNGLTIKQAVDMVRVVTEKRRVPSLTAAAPEENPPTLALPRTRSNG
jgi:hypothetical protein